MSTVLHITLSKQYSRLPFIHPEPFITFIYSTSKFLAGFVLLVFRRQSFTLFQNILYDLHFNTASDMFDFTIEYIFH